MREYVLGWLYGNLILLCISAVPVLWQIVEERRAIRRAMEARRRRLAEVEEMRVLAIEDYWRRQPGRDVA